MTITTVTSHAIGTALPLPATAINALSAPTLKQRLTFLCSVDQADVTPEVWDALNDEHDRAVERLAEIQGSPETQFTQKDESSWHA